MGDYRTYRVSAGKRAATVEWLTRGLEASGCRIISAPAHNVAPFRIIFDTPEGERIGAIFYLFTITCVPTRNRPLDECRFQIKYGNKDGRLHEVWQDPAGLYTTVFLGIDPATAVPIVANIPDPMIAPIPSMTTSNAPSARLS